MLQGTPITVGLGQRVPLPVLLGRHTAAVRPQPPKDPREQPLTERIPDSADLPLAAVDILAASGVAGGSGQLPVAWEPMARPGAQRRGARGPALPGQGWGQRGSAALPGIAGITTATAG